MLVVVLRSIQTTAGRRLMADVEVDLTGPSIAIQATANDAVAYGLAVEFAGERPGGWRAQLRRRHRSDEVAAEFAVDWWEDVVDDDGTVWPLVLVLSLPPATVGAGVYVWDVESTELGRTLASGTLLMAQEVSR